VTLSPGVIETIGVVVPARNEEALLPRCLAALHDAARTLRAGERCPPRVRVVVVVDRSADRTARVAETWPGVEVVHSDAGLVGAARAAGASLLLRTESALGSAPRNVWMACTDADSAVPREWLSLHLQLARTGYGLVLGTVRPDPAELAAGVLDAWRLRHQMTDGHPHVHGANLGVRGDIYLAAGGFPDVHTGEDVLLSVAVRETGGGVVSTGASPVLTSGRCLGRAPGGMAGYLRDLAEDEISLEA
jgi:glycosyltransferase involved in cell wall biosynthesis